MNGMMAIHAIAVGVRSKDQSVLMVRSWIDSIHPTNWVREQFRTKITFSNILQTEIGVNLRSSSSIKYDFLGSWRSTIAENIRVGFTTTNPHGFLLGFSSNITGEYLTIMISNSGHLRVVFDFGFERQEIIYPRKHFGLGQYHDIHFSRKNSGSTVVLRVSWPRLFRVAVVWSDFDSIV